MLPRFFLILAGLLGLLNGDLLVGMPSTQAHAQERSALELFWHSGRGDNFTEATDTGKNVARAGNYRYVRVEGYVFDRDHSGTIPLDLYYHDGRQDNFITATDKGRKDAQNDGYRFVRTIGYIFPTPWPGTVPLKRYWHSGRGDNATVAHRTSQRAQVNSGYSYVGIEGYVFPADDPDLGAETLLIRTETGGSVFARKTQFMVHQGLSGNGCNYTWIGTTGSHPHDAVLTVCDDNTVVGNVRVGGSVHQVNSRSFRAEEVFDYRPAPPIRVTNSNGAEIDVLVVYSQELLEEYDTRVRDLGLSMSGETYLHRSIQLAIDETNAVFWASNINTRLRLKHIELLAGFSESTVSSAKNALERTAPLINHISDIRRCDRGDDPYGLKALRDEVRADLASVWLSSSLRGDGSGHGYYSPNWWYCDEKTGFSTIKESAAFSPQYGFAHELGHNLGAGHAADEPQREDPFTSTYYDLAHVDVNNGFRTIMAYGEACKSASVSCPRVPYFSTPKVKIDPISLAWDVHGVPVGGYQQHCTTYYNYMGKQKTCWTTGTDNARMIYNRVGSVADYLR